MKNHTSMADLLTMTPAELDDLPVGHLLFVQAEIAEADTHLKNCKAIFEFVLEKRYSESVAAAYTKKGDTYGKADFRDDHALISVNTPKKVEWDQDVLASSEKTIRDEWEGDPAEYMTTKRSITEKAWAAWPAPIKKLFEAGRTVDAGKRTIKLSEAQSEDP